MTQATKNDIGKWCKFYRYKVIVGIAKLVYVTGGVKYYRGEGALYDTDSCVPLTDEQVEIMKSAGIIKSNKRKSKEN